MSAIIKARFSWKNIRSFRFGVHETHYRTVLSFMLFSNGEQVL